MIIGRRSTPAILMMAIVGIYTLGTLNAQAPPQEPFDFSKAVLAEVKDNQGKVLLSGQFMESDGDPGEMERKATLRPAGTVADASGEAEVEVSGEGNKRHQEVEFEVQNLQPGAVFTLVIDGRTIATVTADNRGRAKHEREIPLPGVNASR